MSNATEIDTAPVVETFGMIIDDIGKNVTISKMNTVIEVDIYFKNVTVTKGSRLRIRSSKNKDSTTEIRLNAKIRTDELK